jgi:hypothetical protein
MKADDYAALVQAVMDLHGRAAHDGMYGAASFLLKAWQDTLGGGWKSVEEEGRPDPTQWFAAIEIGTERDFEMMVDRETVRLRRLYPGQWSDTITHWCPLPTPPRSDSHKEQQ